MFFSKNKNYFIVLFSVIVLYALYIIGLYVVLNYSLILCKHPASLVSMNIPFPPALAHRIVLLPNSDGNLQHTELYCRNSDARRGRSHRSNSVRRIISCSILSRITLPYHPSRKTSYFCLLDILIMDSNH